LAWKAAGSASQAIYRVWRHRADGPWEALDRARLAEWTGPRPARPGEYEYGVSAVDASGRGETDRAVAAVRVP
jgi:hypothetical protein